MSDAYFSRAERTRIDADQQGLARSAIGTKATGIHRAFGPGCTRVGGIYFTAITPYSFAGACRVLSAAPWSGPSAPSS